MDFAWIASMHRKAGRGWTRGTALGPTGDADDLLHLLEVLVAPADQVNPLFEERSMVSSIVLDWTLVAIARVREDSPAPDFKIVSLSGCRM